jgi:hypothetical protein
MTQPDSAPFAPLRTTVIKLFPGGVIVRADFRQDSEVCRRAVELVAQQRPLRTTILPALSITVRTRRALLIGDPLKLGSHLAELDLPLRQGSLARQRADVVLQETRRLSQGAVNVANEAWYGPHGIELRTTRASQAVQTIVVTVTGEHDSRGQTTSLRVRCIVRPLECAAELRTHRTTARRRRRCSSR